MLGEGLSSSLLIVQVGEVLDCVSLETAFTSADGETFERHLYHRVRKVALALCQPKLPITEDFASFDPENEYNALLASIFADFEAFLACAKGEKPSVGKATSGGDPLAILNSRLAAVCPTVRPSCGRVIALSEDAFRCNDCSIGEAGALCRSCFLASIHATHNYRTLPPVGSYCTCGNDEAWTRGIGCRIHGGDKLQEDKSQPTNDSNSGGGGGGSPRVLRTVEEEQCEEMERLQRRLDALPRDVVKRCTYLLRPLIDSAILVLFELIQGSPRPTHLAPLSRLPKQPSAAGKETCMKKDPDCAEVVDYWPPPLSHLPLSSASEDAARVTAWISASRNRLAFDVVARCRAQQARANRLHPLLFPAPITDPSEARFLTVLCSSPFHEPNAVHMSLRSILPNLDRQAADIVSLARREGRAPIIPRLPLQSARELCDALMSVGLQSIYPPPFYAVDCNIYALEQFFLCFLRWLQRLASTVLPLRPLVCNALLGRYAEFPEGATGADGDPASKTAFLRPGEMLAERSLLARFFELYHAMHHGVRKSVTDVIAAILLQEPIYQSVFAIRLIRRFGRIVHTEVYDKFADDLRLRSLGYQVFAHPKLARQLLHQNSAPLRLISYLNRTFAANSVPLPAFYATQHSRRCLADLFNPNCTFQHFSSDLQNRLKTLRIANRVAWHRAHEYTRIATSTGVDSLADQPRYPSVVLLWLYDPGKELMRTPFGRALCSTRYLLGLLAGLLTMRPLAGESESCPEGWWDAGSRENFMAYFRCLLSILSFIQDMNAMQRTLEGHAGMQQKLPGPIAIIEVFHTVISRTAQLASTDRSLLLSAIKETREAFEQRVGIIDHCFRVGPFTRTQGGSLSGCGEAKIKNITFQTLGATSEVYEYEVAVMRVSIVQPLPRLLAALYGHGIEMGLHPTLLGLADEGFANLVIERPLQMVAFFAQCSTNLWLPNDNLIGDLLEQTSTSLSVETVGRDYQLLQQAAAVLPSDELIVRMVHKLNLKDYLSGTPPSQTRPGSVQAAESLLRVLHFIVTSRSRHAVGYFDPSVVAAIPSSAHLFPPDFKDLDESLEIDYGLLLDDVIHELCVRPMTPSELLSALPPQPPCSCLRKMPPYCGLRAPPTGHNNKWNSSSDIGDAVADLRVLSEDDLKGPVSRILQQVATRTLVGEETKLILRPDVLACRFDLFYPSYRLNRHAVTREAVIRALKQAHEDNTNPLPVDFPIPPPPPRPRRRFVDHLNAPILRLLRCSTFVRLLRQLLDIGTKYGSQQSNWSETLLELVLHLIIIALYEDFVAFTETGEKPFLKAVSQVPEDAESADELERLAEQRHWERQDLPASTTCNCLVPRLEALLEKPYHNRQAGLIKWTLKLWKSIAESQSSSALHLAPALEATEVVSNVEERERRVKADGRSSLIARMADMQRKLFAAHAQFADFVDDDDEDDEEDDKAAVQPAESDGVEAVDLSLDPSNLSRLAVLGPNVHVDRLGVLEKKPASVKCVICLKDCPESSEQDLIVGSLATHSTVLSAPPPCSHAVFSDSGNATSPIYCTSADHEWIDRNLAAIATSTVASSVGNGRTLPPPLSRLLIDLCSCVPDRGERTSGVKKKTKKKKSGTAAFSSAGLGYGSGQLRPDDVNKTTLAADPWLSRPLVASRDPIGEEGTFIAFCPHVMHADCKEKNTRQMKAHSFGVLVPKSKCPACKALSNFDLPLYGRITDGLSPVWLSRQLTTGQNSLDLDTWLGRLRCWLNERPPLAPPGSATDRQHMDLPVSLKELYRIIDPSKSRKSGKRRAGQPMTICSARLSQLRAFLTEVLRTCGPAFTRHEIQTSLPVAIPPESRRTGISTSLRVLVQRLSVLSQAAKLEAVEQPSPLDILGISFNYLVKTDMQPPLNPVLNRLSISFSTVFRQINALAQFVDLDVEEIWSKDRADEKATAAAAVPNLVSPDQVDRFRQTARALRDSVKNARLRSLQAVWLAACDWRALRHSVAYTLVVWERFMRQQSPSANFFNGGLGERYRRSLGYLLRTTFQAHARLAPVSRGCPASCQNSDSEASTHAHHTECWLQRRDDPDWWWWYSYFAPAPPGAAHAGCCRDTASTASAPLEPVTRVAVSEDAARLWRLLLPDCRSADASPICETVEVGGTKLGEGSASSSTTGPTTTAPTVDDSLGSCSGGPPVTPYQSVSVLWEADITFLFVNLLFLRPGLEEKGAAVECQRLRSLRAISTSEGESGAAANGGSRQLEMPPLAACDEGFPRLPIGDSHEAFLLRLCYLALLVQALLSWPSNGQKLRNDQQQQESVYSETDPYIVNVRCIWYFSNATARLPNLTLRASLAGVLILCDGDDEEEEEEEGGDEEEEDIN
ncbi:hypothetical protein SprV_0100503400 [Sparganum proliferum]